MSTATLNETYTLDMTEFEEAKPCDGTWNHDQPCGNQAKWACWVAHDYRKCPYELNFCDPHKKNAIAIWEHLITCKAGHKCPHCNTQLRGKQLNQVFRALEL